MVGVIMDTLCLFGVSCRPTFSTTIECSPQMEMPKIKGELCSPNTWSHNMQPRK